MKIRFIFILLFIFFCFEKTIHAKSRCENFYNQIIQAEINENLNDEPSIEDSTVGFNLQVNWDSSKDNNYGDWVTKTNKDGYPFVGKIRSQKLMGKINVGDLILEANGKDIRSFKLDQNDPISFSQNFEDKENEFKFKDKNNKTYNLKTNKIDIIASAYSYDIYINHINIDDKTGSFDINMKKEFLGSLFDYHGLFKYAKANLLYKNDENKFKYEECLFSTKKWRDLDYVLPDYGIVFDNIVLSDKSLQREDYFIQPNFKEINPNLEESYLDISYRFEGTKTIRSNFNLKSFPFDRQELKLYLYQSRYELENSDTAPTDWTQREIDRYLKQEEPIQGWTIVDYSMSYKPHFDPNYKSWSDGVEYKFTVERNSSYYIYKVIFPIILILIICWSAVWIDPREIESRLTITIVCLLSLIAYNFVIDSELPKLEYLTIMDYIILISYVYAAIPNFLSIYSFQLIKKNKALAEKYESYEKKYGLTSYILLIFMIIVFNASSAPEHTNSIFSWAAMQN